MAGDKEKDETKNPRGSGASEPRWLWFRQTDGRGIKSKKKSSRFKDADEDYYGLNDPEVLH